MNTKSHERDFMGAEFMLLVTELMTINLEKMNKEEKQTLLKKIDEHISQYLRLINDNNFRYRVRNLERYLNYLKDSKERVGNSTDHNTQGEIDCFKTAITCFEQILQCYYCDNNSPPSYQNFASCHQVIRKLQEAINILIPHSQRAIKNTLPPESKTTASNSQRSETLASPSSLYLSTIPPIITSDLSSSPTSTQASQDSSFAFTNSTANNAFSSTSSSTPQNIMLPEKEKEKLINKLKAYYDPDKLSLFRFPIADDRKECVANLISLISHNTRKENLLEHILKAQSDIVGADFKSDFGIGLRNLRQQQYRFFKIARNQTGSRLMGVLNELVRDIMKKTETTLLIDPKKIKIDDLLCAISMRARFLKESGIDLPKGYENIPSLLKETNLEEIKNKLSKNISVFDHSQHHSSYQTGLINLMKSTVQLLEIPTPQSNLTASNKPKLTR